MKTPLFIFFLTSSIALSDDPNFFITPVYFNRFSDLSKFHIEEAEPELKKLLNRSGAGVNFSLKYQLNYLDSNTYIILACGVFDSYIMFNLSAEHSYDRLQINGGFLVNLAGSDYHRFNQIVFRDGEYDPSPFKVNLRNYELGVSLGLKYSIRKSNKFKIDGFFRSSFILTSYKYEALYSSDGGFLYLDFGLDEYFLTGETITSYQLEIGLEFTL